MDNDTIILLVTIAIFYVAVIIDTIKQTRK